MRTAARGARTQDRKSKQAKQGKREGSNRQRGWVPTGASASPAAGRAQPAGPQQSWSCWQPARAAALRTACAAGGPHIPRHTCVGSNTQAAEPISAEGPPAAATADASLGDACRAQGGAGGSSAGCQAGPQLASKGKRPGQGQGRNWWDRRGSEPTKTGDVQVGAHAGKKRGRERIKDKKGRQPHQWGHPARAGRAGGAGGGSAGGRAT